MTLSNKPRRLKVVTIVAAVATLAGLSIYMSRPALATTTNGIFLTSPLSQSLRSPGGRVVSGTDPCNVNPANYTSYTVSNINLGAISGQPFTRCYSLIQQKSAGTHPIVFMFGGGSVVDTNGDIAGTTEFIPFLNAALAQGYDIGFIGREKYTLNGADAGSALQISQPQVNLINAVLDDAINNHSADSSRVYALGFSTGGNVPLYFSCWVSSRTTAVVSIGGALQGPAEDLNGVGLTPCSKPTDPVSVMFIQSDTDSYFGKLKLADGSTPPDPYTLHTTPLSSGDLTEVQSTDTTVKWYGAQHDAEGSAWWWNCVNNRSVSQPTFNGTTAINVYKWTGCNDQSGSNTGEVFLYDMPGGHGNHEFDPLATDALNFFNRHDNTPISTPKIGDLNNDGSVNNADIAIITSAWGSNNDTDDLNNNGVVDIYDFSILLAHFGT